MSAAMSDNEKEENRQLHKRLDEQSGTGSDEEFAEQLYDDKAPTPPEFQKTHRISTTGGQLEDSDSANSP